MSIRDVGDGARRLTSNPKLEKSALILKHAHSSAKALLGAFDGLRSRRGGAPSDAQQDILRSMLVLSSAGLDSIVKQLIRDTLVEIAEKEEKVLEGVEAFARKQIKGFTQPSLDTSASKFLSQILIAESQRNKLFELYIEDLTGHSLQSVEELMKALYALAIEPSDISLDINKFREIFKIRNKIVHELDIQFGGVNRSRKSRTRATMVNYTNAILSLGEKIILIISNKIR